jgi:hypothetical protein
MKPGQPPQSPLPLSAASIDPHIETRAITAEHAQEFFHPRFFVKTAFFHGNVKRL